MPTILTDTYLQRFAGIGRLYGQEALAGLAQAHFVVVGLGGVGTWAAEALVRSGIGEITLIELDEVCISNTNRQSHATQSNIGKPKVDIVSSRLKDINPECTVNRVNDFLTKNNIRDYIDDSHHIVIDAIDATHIKTALAAYASAKKIRLITVGSSGGKLNPQLITCSDLGKVSSDPILAKMKSLLYRRYNFIKDKKRKFRIDAVYSAEQMVYPKPDGSVCMEKNALQDGVKLDCTGGMGSSVMVTGSFGFMAAHKGIERYLEKYFSNDASNSDSVKTEQDKL